MKKTLSILVLLYALFTAPVFAENKDTTYYARCNMKVLNGTTITWVNWQGSAEYIPVGTPLIIKREKSKIKFVNTMTNQEYTVYTGMKDEKYLEKFISKNKILITNYPKSIQEDIAMQVISKDMTKEQAYIAMGPPSWITSGNTCDKTYEDIIQSNIWVYKRRKFRKNIGITFNPSTNLVQRTQGIFK